MWIRVSQWQAWSLAPSNVLLLASEMMEYRLSSIVSQWTVPVIFGAMADDRVLVVDEINVRRLVRSD